MPYSRKKRVVRKRKPYTGPKFTKKMRGYYRKIGNYARPEVKWHDETTDVYSVGPPAMWDQFRPMNRLGNMQQGSIVTIPQGVGQNERIGRKVTITRIDARIRVFLHGTSDITKTSSMYKIVFLWDKQANGTAPAIGQVWEKGDVAGTPTYLGEPIQRFKEKANGGRFVHLKTITGTISHSGGGLGGTDTWPLKTKYITFSKRVNIPIEFNGTDGVVAEVRSNNLAVATFSTGPNVEDVNETDDVGLCSCSIMTRVSYTDA